MADRYVHLPFKPLYRFMQIQSGLQPYNKVTKHGYSVRQMGEPLNVTDRTVQRWVKKGLILKAAEDAAFTQGVHPEWIWGQAWWDAVRKERAWVTLEDDDPVDPEIFSVYV